MSRLMWKDMRKPVLMEDYAGAPVPTRRPDLPTDVSESVTVTGIRPPDPSLVPALGGKQAPPASHGREPRFLEGLSVGAEHTSRFLEGKEGFVGQVEEFGKSRGLLDGDNFGRVTRGLSRAGTGLSIAGEALGAADDYRNGAPLKVVVPGAVMHGGGAAVGGFLGGALLSPLGPLGVAAGGIIGSYLADKYLLPDRKVLGEKFNKAMEESADRPYYSGPS
ncbi:MAG: hypothetical protein V4601_04085 [Pseudomonadota bacterium]